MACGEHEKIQKCGEAGMFRDDSVCWSTLPLELKQIKQHGFIHLSSFYPLLGLIYKDTGLWRASYLEAAAPLGICMCAACALCHVMGT